MRMAITFGFNQVISHGFGLFLFAALVPLMQESIDITSWHLATIGALTQLSYLGGAMILGIIGHRMDSGRLLIGTGILTSCLLFSMAWLNDPLIITCVLTVMAASAAISWGGIVEMVTSYGRLDRTSTNLSIASSGTAWGYSLNGLIILLVVPIFGWRSGWIAASVFGLITLFATITLLRHMRQNKEEHDIEVTFAMTSRQLFATVFKERTAFLSCLVLFLVGLSTMTFSTWLNTFLAQLNLPAALGGYTWSVIGMTGMVVGFFAGKLADSKGHGIALLIIFGAFALGLLAFTYDPARFVLLAGLGYGLMYFPIWGIVAGWVSKHYSSKATMQINGIGMVTFGLGGALGNLAAGAINEFTGSLMNVYWLITAMGCVLFVLAAYIYLSDRKPVDEQPLVGAV
ncbi:Major Facilitator Superfamily protein [Marinomonas gallaica]|uniref:Major Facilitator Superfamily protein n=1 Tax=Marinomonas gallaica TaxID=1806667 RepID=A0A1C3JRU6_9GAMM|nr:MFS transporter [Marinomonas gallaica]SBT17958.1 Major Facilitator Superfamily protein [Marinomonas gallaica]SBT20743.1 Major Facilitator Superfamily protein [Marinomonas gallaica]